jgi:hypothetical protein
MIDTNKYKIEDDVVWIWKENLDDNYDMIKNSPKPSGWVLWEYKECPPEKGGYPIYREGEDDEITHEPWNQLLPAIPSTEWNENMEAIQDVPFLISEIKQLQDALKEAVIVVKEMENMAYADADVDKFSNHALEFIGSVREMIE